MYVTALTWTMLFHLLFLTSASPLERRAKSAALSNLDLPPSSLPPPPSTWSLQYVLLGVGTQNYTCNGAASDGPGSNGAKADLYDMTPLLVGSSSMKQANIQAIPPLALSLNAYAPAMFSNLRLKQVGKHFFAPGGVPTFDLSSAKPAAKISVKKGASTPAPPPPVSCPGTRGEGAVDWLQLVDAGTTVQTTTTGLAGGAVYRVETAGGKSPATCSGLSGDVLVPYTAEYWIYGPN